ncbi:SOS response-associated peptidase [Candidatus Protochlamydia phocaeensis]|uniref:SOS response-associated peptidase n=1 Tax=Candidatus Protochlamydia phocaeensis TaxID=1414722 RepID=UPI0008385B39|nr:SOS response-associated peptidase [Candidatus Protochlamydia phocaeensis]
MCGRFSLAIDDIEDLALRFHVPLPDTSVQPRYNIAPAQPLLTVAHVQGKRQLIPMLWGLVPHWNKSAKSSYTLINIRSESLTEKPLFKRYFEHQRCLVPADGFFEWKKAGTKKIPYRAIVKKEPIFAFAGLWDFITQPDGSKAYCFTILTTEANDLLRPIHDRMPVILLPDEEDKWLDPSIQVGAHLQPLLHPYPAKRMEVYEVSPKVNSWKNDTPECIEPKAN